eukprot:5535707-Pyramimonas_sp.AAC.1
MAEVPPHDGAEDALHAGRARQRDVEDVEVALQPRRDVVAPPPRVRHGADYLHPLQPLVLPRPLRVVPPAVLQHAPQRLVRHLNSINRTGEFTRSVESQC